MRTTSRAVTGAVAVVASLALAAPAGAASTNGKGNPQGKTEQGPQHARSLCAFSGLNDDPDHAFPEGGLAQSYGQLVAQGVKEFVPSPGFACNPTSGFGGE